MKHLPFTSVKFQGKAEQFIEDSVAVPLEKKQLPDSAPNVLLIMLDDGIIRVCRKNDSH